MSEYIKNRMLSKAQVSAELLDILYHFFRFEDDFLVDPVSTKFGIPSEASKKHLMFH